MSHGFRIQQNLKKAKCFVLFLSNGYLQSEWCQKELDHFLENNSQNPESIFVVELDSVPVENKPVQLQQALGYRFWYKEQLSTETYPLEPDSTEYKKQQLKLSKDIAKQIQKIEEFNNIIQEAKQASRNKAHDEAIELWTQVQELQPNHPIAQEEINNSQQKKQQQSQAEQLVMQLFARMQEITPVFADVALSTRAKII